jgi:hypothetical protein
MLTACLGPRLDAPFFSLVEFRLNQLGPRAHGGLPSPQLLEKSEEKEARSYSQFLPFFAEIDSIPVVASDHNVQTQSDVSQLVLQSCLRSSPVVSAWQRLLMCLVSFAVW